MHCKGNPKCSRKARKEICEKCPDHGICLAEEGKKDYYCTRDDPRNPRNT